MRVWVAWLALIVGIASPAFSAVERFSLANGLEVVVVENHRVPAVTHMLWYRVGAADDAPGKSGIAHYLEHLMFQGTPRYPAGEYAAQISRAGGRQNAFTSADATAYHVTISKDELPLAMQLEADRMRGLSPRDADVSKEQEVIIEERRARIENHPQSLFYEQLNAALFRHHPYRLPVIGWMHEMQGLTQQDALRFHARWYRPNNAVLVLSGDITAKEARPLVERYYSDIPRAAVPARIWADEPPHHGARFLSMRHANVKQPLWARLYATSSLGYGERKHALPLVLLSQLLGGGKTSDLYRYLVVDEKMASEVSVNYDAFSRGPGRFEISITPEPGISLDALEKAVDGRLQKRLAEGFSADELARAKTLLKAEAIYARDGLESMARVMGWIRMLNLDEEYFLRWPEMIAAITPGELAAAMRHTFEMKQSVTGRLLPPEPAKETAK